jgi:hypothetical protein
MAMASFWIHSDQLRKVLVSAVRVAMVYFLSEHSQTPVFGMIGMLFACGAALIVGYASIHAGIATLISSRLGERTNNYSFTSRRSLCSLRGRRWYVSQGVRGPDETVALSH